MKTNAIPLVRPMTAFVAALCFQTPASLSAVEGGAAASTSDKTHVLFMGADIDVQVNKAMHRVKNVAGDSFVVSIDQKPAEVPMNRGRINMKVTPQLKLSDKTAQVRELKFERAYTPHNDPNRKWAARQSGSAGQARSDSRQRPARRSSRSSRGRAGTRAIVPSA